MISLAIDVTAQRLSHDELRRVLAVAQILRDIGATLVAELDTAQVMKTITGAARKLTGATMGAFLALDPDEPDGVLFVRAGSGRVRESSLGVVGADRRRRCSRPRSRHDGRSASTTRPRTTEYARDARRDHAVARSSRCAAAS